MGVCHEEGREEMKMSFSRKASVWVGGIHLMCHSLLQLQATDVCRPSNTFGLPQYISIRTLLSFPFLTILSSSFLDLSSPRAKLTGSKGLRAESARAFTGRRNSHSGRGEDFLSRQPDFFTETAVTSERKVEKSFPRWEINRHDKG